MTREDASPLDRESLGCIGFPSDDECPIGIIQASSWILL